MNRGPLPHLYFYAQLPFIVSSILGAREDVIGSKGDVKRRGFAMRRRPDARRATDNRERGWRVEQYMHKPANPSRSSLGRRWFRLGRWRCRGVVVDVQLAVRCVETSQSVSGKQRRARINNLHLFEDGRRILIRERRAKRLTVPSPLLVARSRSARATWPSPSPRRRLRRLRPRRRGAVPGCT